MCVAATIFHIPTYSSINKHPLVMKAIIGIFNVRSPWPKLSNAWEVDILFMYFERFKDNTWLTNMTFTQKLYVRSHSISTIFMFTVDDMTLNQISVTFLPNKVY